MLLTRERTAKSQLGFQIAVNNAAYTIGGGDINFANGQMILLRFPTTMPKFSTITSAAINFNMVVKTSTTTQTSLHRIWADASGDSPMLIPGREEWGVRRLTSSYVNWTAAWLGKPSDDTTPQYNNVDITSIVQELVYRDDWQAGGYITLMIQCLDETGSDMGIRANNDFLPTPRIQINYNEPLLDQRATVNMCENSEFSTAIQAVGTDGNVAPYWGQNEFFGAFVSPANYGTFAVDNSFTRVAGVPTLRFTCAAPPTDATKRTGPVYAMSDNTDQGAVFCGWVYVPANVGVTTGQDFFVGDPYRSAAGKTVTVRGTWVPFCTDPDPIAGTSWGSRYFALGLRNFTVGQQFWISEPSIIRSTFRQMPFNGLTPDREPDIDHRSGVSKMQSSRVWTPKRTFKINGIPRAYPTWVQRADGILQLAEPIKGGPRISSLTGTIESLDTTKSISEL